jgi:esterase/lipase
MPQIFELLGSSDKQALWIDHSNHLITLDAEREKVFRAAADFISRIESQGAEKASSSTAR